MSSLAQRAQAAGGVCKAPELFERKLSVPSIALSADRDWSRRGPHSMLGGADRV